MKLSAKGDLFLFIFKRRCGKCILLVNNCNFTCAMLVFMSRTCYDKKKKKLLTNFVRAD